MKTGEIWNGRFTADIEGSFVVFLIGMRINKFLAFNKWWPTAMAMPKMLKALAEHPHKGLLGAHSWVRWREAMVVQYWSSFETLEDYARDPGEDHLPAWKRFNQAVGADGSVGIWHETYLVESKKYECIYGNMPRFGLAKAANHVEATGNRETARLRLGEIESPSEPFHGNAQ